MSEFTIKDSGTRAKFASGMVRDADDSKTEWHRILEGPMVKRWAEHLTKGATKYPDVEPGRANWTLAAGKEELARFKASAVRHFIQWFRGDVDEDHAAAVIFNINGAEYVKERMANDNSPRTGEGSKVETARADCACGRSKSTAAARIPEVQAPGSAGTIRYANREASGPNYGLCALAPPNGEFSERVDLGGELGGGGEARGGL